MKAKTYLPFYMVISLFFSGICPTFALVGEAIKPVPKEIENEVWPELTAKVLIKASPLQSVAIFAAYDYQKHYVPGLLESTVIKEVVSKGKNDTQVSYKLDMPWPISDSEYLHGHELTQPTQTSYRVRWYLIKSDSADNVRGTATFAPHPENPQYTLMTYISLVSPKSFAAGIFKKIMVGDVVKSLSAIRDTTEKLVKNQPQLVQQYEGKIQQVLRGENAYLPK